MEVYAHKALNAPGLQFMVQEPGTGDDGEDGDPLPGDLPVPEVLANLRMTMTPGECCPLQADRYKVLAPNIVRIEAVDW